MGLSMFGINCEAVGQRNARKVNKAVEIKLLHTFFFNNKNTGECGGTEWGEREGACKKIEQHECIKQTILDL